MIFPYSSKVQIFVFILVLRKHECKMTQPIKRPYGITIIAILAIVGGMVLIFGGTVIFSIWSILCGNTY